MNLKGLLLLFTLQCAMLTNAASVDVDVDIEIRDAMTLKPIDRVVEVSILTKEGHELFQGSSSEDGRLKALVEIEKEVTELQIIIVDTSNYFRQKKSYLYLGINESFKSSIFLLVSQKTRAQWRASEDSIYGRSNEDVLSEEMNTKGLICGCASYDFKEASFVGGSPALRKYVIESLFYSEEALNMGEQGRVEISFVVEANGDISHIQVARGVSENLDYEGLRLIKNMPKWLPANCNDQPVRSHVALPIFFDLH